MKLIKIIITAVVLSLQLVSCKKFLDIPRNSGNIVPVSTAEECQFLLDNTETFNFNYPFDANISSDDYYLNDGDLTNQSVEDQEIYKWDAVMVRPSDQWTSNYFKIYSANLVLEGVDKIKSYGKSDAVTLNGLRGAALFFRAFTHWQLAQIYAKPYIASTAGSDIGIPIRLTSDMNDRPGRGTVKQTYDLIVQDLEEAVTLMKNTSVKATRPNKAAAYAMLARVYNSMGEYAKAGINASAALLLNSNLTNFNGLDQNNPNPFNMFQPEVIFHSTTAGKSILYPDQGGGSYIARIAPDLAASFDDNDLRKKIFLKDNGDGTYRFSGNYQPTLDPNFFNGLSVDELYLIRAESYARAGNYTLAMNDINTLLASRYATGTYVNQTATTELAALTIILAERRKELIMRGLRWTDLRRLNQDTRFAKTLERKKDGNGSVIATLPANDLRYVLLIPLKVIEFGVVAQNPR